MGLSFRAGTAMQEASQRRNAREQERWALAQRLDVLGRLWRLELLECLRTHDQALARGDGLACGEECLEAQRLNARGAPAQRCRIGGSLQFAQIPQALGQTVESVSCL